MFHSIVSVYCMIICLDCTALDCYNNVYGDGEQQTIQDIQLGLSIAGSVFAIASEFYPPELGPNPFSLADDTLDIANYAIGYYGDSISDDRSIWKCLDGYIQTVVSEVYDEIASFENHKAKQIVNNLLKPVNNLAINHNPNDEQLRIGLCNLIDDYMNQQSFENWNFCDKFGSPDCYDDLHIKYYYLALPFLVQYINLRFDVISWLYNSSNIIECELSGPHDYDARVQLYAFYQDTRDLFNMYLHTLPYLINDININSHLPEKRRSNYYITNYGSPSILCKWFKTSFAIFENTMDYQSELRNDTEIINFDMISWSNFARHDFSMFEQDCDSALIAWLMKSIQPQMEECAVPHTYRTGKGSETLNEECRTPHNGTGEADASNHPLLNSNFIAAISTFMLFVYVLIY